LYIALHNLFDNDCMTIYALNMLYGNPWTWAQEELHCGVTRVLKLQAVGYVQCKKSTSYI
jgi:hypothetical protein